MYDSDTYKTKPFARLVYRWVELDDVDCSTSSGDHFTKAVSVDVDNIDHVVELVCDAVRLVRLNLSPEFACAELGIRNHDEEELRFITDLIDCSEEELEEIVREVVNE